MLSTLARKDNTLSSVTDPLWVPRTPWQLHRMLRTHETVINPDLPSPEAKTELRTLLRSEQTQGWALAEKNTLTKSLVTMLVLHASMVLFLVYGHTPSPMTPRVERSSDTIRQAVFVSLPVEKEKVVEAPKPVAPLVHAEKTVAEFVPVPAPPKKVAKALPKKVKRVRTKKVAKAAPMPKKKSPDVPMSVVTSEAKQAPLTQVAALGDSIRGMGAPSPIAGDNSGGDESALLDEAPVSLIDLEGLQEAYLGELNARFQKERSYPRAAKRAGIQGKVVVEITIDANGKITGTHLIHSSGHSILDAAAIQAVSAVGELPAPPSSLKWQGRSMRIPFVYRLS